MEYKSIYEKTKSFSDAIKFALDELRDISEICDYMIERKRGQEMFIVRTFDVFLDPSSKTEIPMKYEEFETNFQKDKIKILLFIGLCVQDSKNRRRVKELKRNQQN